MVAYAPQAWERMWGHDVPTLTDTAVCAHWPEIARRYRAAERAAERRRQEEADRVSEEAESVPIPPSLLKELIVQLLDRWDRNQREE